MITRKDKVVAALRRLSATERSEVFHEVGACTCAALAREAVKHPEATAGAVLGALAGALFKVAVESKMQKQIAKAQADPDLLDSLLKGK